MLAFHIINGLWYARTDFVGILTDLQGNNYNANAWYQPSNLDQTLNKAVSHNKASSNIFECAHKQDPSNHSQNAQQNKHEQNRHEKPKVDDDKNTTHYHPVQARNLQNLQQKKVSWRNG